MTDNKPIKTIRFGNIKAAIWQNEQGIQNVTIEKIFRDKTSGSWKSSKSFGKNELPKLVKAAQEAFEFVTGMETRSEAKG